MTVREWLDRRLGARGVARYVDLDDEGLTIRFAPLGLDAIPAGLEQPLRLPLRELALVVVGVDPEGPGRDHRTFWFFDRRGDYTSGSGKNVSSGDILSWMGKLPGLDASRVPPGDAPEQIVDVWRRKDVRCPRCDQRVLADASNDPTIATGKRWRPLYSCACGRIVQIGFTGTDRPSSSPSIEPIDWDGVVGATVSPRGAVTPERFWTFDGFFTLRSSDGRRRIVWADAVDAKAFVSALSSRLRVSEQAIVEAMIRPGDEVPIAGAPRDLR